jgi:hypothetical protein
MATIKRPCHDIVEHVIQFFIDMMQLFPTHLSFQLREANTLYIFSTTTNCGQTLKKGEIYLLSGITHVLFLTTYVIRGYRH